MCNRSGGNHWPALVKQVANALLLLTNVKVPMNSADLYKEAYDLHYKERATGRALLMYGAVIERFPASQEATYARTQIENLGGIPIDPQEKIRLEERLDSERLETELLAELAVAKDEHLSENRGRWQYKLLVDATEESLDTFGSLGWEVVSSAAYKTGGGLTVSGLGGERYTVHIQHTLKRKVIKTQSEKMMIISNRINQVKALRTQSETRVIP